MNLVAQSFVILEMWDPHHEDSVPSRDVMRAGGCN